MQSDYWKGFSYSLIKERDFTCADCGKRFPNERNKLQVHHLVYRDVNPWSYKPEEMVVLCEECHKKRHGIYSEPIKGEFEGYSRSYSFSPDSRQERSFSYSSETKDETRGTTNSFGGYTNTKPRTSYNAQQNRSRRQMNVKNIVLSLFALLFLFLLLRNISDPKSSEAETRKHTNSTIEQNKTNTYNPFVTPLPVVGEEQETTGNKSLSRPTQKSSAGRITKNAPVHTPQPAVPSSYPQPIEVDTKLPEKSIVSKGVEETQKTEEITELSTQEINDRIYRAHVEEQARKAGVSTEGTTQEINDRIYRAHVEEQARKAGVSTEGTKTK